jgi:DNA mismatch repair protein MutS2
MTFAPGDPVHVALFGRGIVREARNGGRYLVEVKRTAMVVTASQLTASDARPPARRLPVEAPGGGLDVSRGHAASSIDLHGKTTLEAAAAVDEFLNDALLAGIAEARIIHGISGGRVKAAVHARLKQIGSVRAFRIDPSNPGVTIVTL